MGERQKNVKQTRGQIKQKISEILNAETLKDVKGTFKI